MRVRIANEILLVKQVECLDTKIVLHTFSDDQKEIILNVLDEAERDAILQGLYLEGFLEVKLEWL